MADDLPMKTAEALDWDQLGIVKPAQGPVTKTVIRDALRVLITPHLGKMVQAQVAQACGLSYMVVRDRAGKFTRIPDGITPAALDALLGEDGVIVEVWTKDPSTPAFTDLVNRAADKPKEQEQEIIVTNGEETLRRLDAWKLAHRNEQE